MPTPMRMANERLDEDLPQDTGSSRMYATIVSPKSITKHNHTRSFITCPIKK